VLKLLHLGGRQSTLAATNPYAELQAIAVL